MVQPRFLPSVAVIVVLTVLDCNNCNAGITNVRDGFINGISSSDLTGFDRKNQMRQIKWLKRQVRKLNKETDKFFQKVSTNTDDISELDGKMKTNMLEIGFNNGKIEDNKENISENDVAIDGNIEDIDKNAEDLENFQNSILDEIADNEAAIANNTADVKTNEDNIKNNAKDIIQLEALFEILNTTEKTMTTAEPPMNPCSDESISDGLVVVSGVSSYVRLIQDVCYTFPNVAKNYTDAQEICKQQNGFLFNPRSKEQNTNVAIAVFNIFGNDQVPQVFMGVNDLKEEGQFMFSDGSELTTFEHWYNGYFNVQPDDGGEGYDQDCGTIWIYEDGIGGDDGTWYDSNCEDKYYFVCELSD